MFEVITLLQSPAAVVPALQGASVFSSLFLAQAHPPTLSMPSASFETPSPGRCICTAPPLLSYHHIRYHPEAGMLRQGKVQVQVQIPLAEVSLRAGFPAILYGVPYSLYHGTQPPLTLCTCRQTVHTRASNVQILLLDSLHTGERPNDIRLSHI